METAKSRLNQMKEKEKEDESDDLGLQAGTVIESSRGKYTVEELLGEGGFGAVYRVRDIKDATKVYAMKVEKTLETRKHSKLKMEISVLKLNPGRFRGTNCHFTQLIDRGKKESYTFMIMELVGKSLSELKAERPQRVFTPTCALALGIQCLEGCEDLHKMGYIHRDLKPANFACGIGETARVIFILDFGISRKVTNDKGEIKAPRESMKFKGTVKFAALACHYNRELGTKDDCECWFYLVVDCLLPAGLAWKKLRERNEVQRMKEDCRKEKRHLLVGTLKCSPDLSIILDYIDKLSYCDKVDYEFIYKKLHDGIASVGGNVKAPYDWEVVTTKSQTKSVRKSSMMRPAQH